MVGRLLVNESRGFVHYMDDKETDGQFTDLIFFNPKDTLGTMSEEQNEEIRERLAALAERAGIELTGEETPAEILDKLDRLDLPEEVIQALGEAYERLSGREEP
jgi:hypothetical protein